MEQFKFSPVVLILPVGSLLGLWMIFWIGLRFDIDFSFLGIYPRSIQGLPGIFLSWLIHANLEHLYNNSLPLLVLLAALAFFYRFYALKVIVFGIFLSGLITWFIGRDSCHLGASGLLYALVSFIFFKGISTRYYRLVAVSLLAVFLYGSMVWYVFPGIDNGISWEAHLGGLAAGFSLSKYFKTPEYRKPILYDWEHPDYDGSADKFMQRFDASGNFVNPQSIDTICEAPVCQTVVYHYKEGTDTNNSQT